MATLYRIPAGLSYPATAADFKLARASKPHKRVESDEARTIAAPYPEIVPSWLANGVTSIDEAPEEVNE